MKKILGIIISLILFMHRYYAVNPGNCSLIPKVVLEGDGISKYVLVMEKAEYFNDLIRRLWNEDFGKFLQVFCVGFFKNADVVNAGNLDLDKVGFNFHTIEIAEFMMFYLCTASLNRCVKFFGELVSFFKRSLRDDEKKESILYGLREFTCCSLIELFKCECVTKELIAQKYLIMGELYDQF